MTDWQKKWVRENGSKLKSATQCDQALIDKLVEAQVLTEGSYLLNSTCTPYDRSSGLYNMLLNTKIRGYEALTKALYECGQTKAAGILLDGMRSQRGPCQDAKYDPFVQCGIKIDMEDISKIKVSLRGKENQITDFLSHVDPENLLDVFDTNDLKYDLLHLIMSTRKEIELLKNDIPEKPAYYVERFISNRLRLNPNIFKENIKDVFLFKGLTEIELFKLAGENDVIPLTRKLLNKHNKARFVLIDDEKDWKQIRESIDRNVPVHVICTESIPANHSSNGEPSLKEFILERVDSDSVDIWKWVENPSKDGKPYISESKFVKTVASAEEKAGYCICDLPGMGKSFLLTEIARKIKETHPTRLVLLVDLMQFNKACKMQEIPHRFLQDNPLEVLIKYVASSKICEKILLEAVRNGGLELELLFDGFDELPKHELEPFKMFLKRILDVNGHTNIYITARGNLRNELQISLGAIAYDILPFTPDNQVDFLTKYWKSKSSKQANLGEDRLKVMADACLGSLFETMQCKDFMGIPLKCYFLAEIYLDQALSYSRSNSNEKSPTIPQSSHFELYERFMNQCYSRAQSKFAAQGFQYDLKTLKSFHTFRALELICPEMASEYSRLEGLDKINLQDSDVYFVGILVGGTNTDKNSNKFVHKTVAENLIAEFVVRIFQKENFSDYDYIVSFSSSFQKLCVQVFSVQQQINGSRFHNENLYYYTIRCVEYAFLNPFIVNLINCSLTKLDIIQDDNILSAYIGTIKSIGFYNFLNACVVKDLYHLLRVVINVLEARLNMFPCIKKLLYYRNVSFFGKKLKKPQELEWETLRRDRYHYQIPAASMLAFKAALISSVETMKECLRLLKNCNLTVKDVCTTHLSFIDSYKNFKYTLFHAVGDSCDVYMFFHFWQNFKPNMPLKDLLYWFATDSLNLNGKRLKSTIYMCDLLISEMDNVLGHKTLRKLAIAKNVHPEILERLWKKDEKAVPAHKHGENIIHLALNSMKMMWHFNDLCELVLSISNRITFFKTTSEWKSPIPFIRNLISSAILDTGLFIRIQLESKPNLQKEFEIEDGFHDFENRFGLRFTTNFDQELYKTLVELGDFDTIFANKGQKFRKLVAGVFNEEKYRDSYKNLSVPQKNEYDTLNFLSRQSHSTVATEYLIDLEKRILPALSTQTHRWPGILKM